MDPFANIHLGPISNATKQDLDRILWSWSLCGQCKDQPSCGTQSCPWSREKDLRKFWELYESLSAAYCPGSLGRKEALESHQKLLTVIKRVQSRRAVPRTALIQEIFETNQADDNQRPAMIDQDRAFRIGASIAFLMDFGILHDAANILEGSVPHTPWRDGVCADDFLGEVFPASKKGPVSEGILGSLTAKRLRKTAELRFIATNDIRRHLVLDCENRTLYIFNQSIALREYLLSSGNDSTEAGYLPRSLVIEVLDTIHRVLFPLNPDSFKILDTLVEKEGFDKGLKLYATIPYRQDGDTNVAYEYFGDRLAKLYDELQSPTPRGGLQRRFKRKGEAYMLMATMVGVFIAVIIGFLGLLVSTFQAWVAYQQWKHPVES